MAFKTFIKDTHSKADVSFKSDEIYQSNVNQNYSTFKTKTKKKLVESRKTPHDKFSLPQSKFEISTTPWDVNKKSHYHQPNIQSSSSSSPESIISSNLTTPRSKPLLIRNDLQIQFNQQSPHSSTIEQDESNNQLFTSEFLDNLKNSNSHQQISTNSISNPTDSIIGYPKSVNPTSSISTESILSIQRIGNETTSSSYYSLHPTKSTQLLLHQSLPLNVNQLSSSSFTNQSPNLSPRTTQPLTTCQTCQFPLQRTSSESSFLVNLSHRSPLFNDLDEECTSHSCEPDNSNQDCFLSCSPSSSSSTSPEAFNSLCSWWSDIPPHRRAHIIEADSWPIFTPNVLPSVNGSLTGEQCSCPAPLPPDPSTEISEVDLTEQVQTSQESSFISSPPRPGYLQPRLSFSKNLNLLVPIPLDQDETDPLLLTSPSSSIDIPLTLTPVTQSNTQDADIVHHANKKKKRKEESIPKSSESLLTKSLRRLSRKLPNIQWGNLSVCSQNNNHVDGKNSTPTGEEEQEEEIVLPSGVVDEDSSVGLAFEDEKAQISKLVKSWTLDNIQPQNSLNGSFINDPEMEWSSMVVQLETFSPNSSKQSRSKLSTQPDKKVLRSSRVQQYSKKINNVNMDSTSSRPNQNRRNSDEGIADTTGSKKKSPRGNNRSTRNQHNKANHDHKKNAVKITKRVVSNPLHLLQLTLELEMMRKMKINSPLKQRSMKLILIKRGLGSQSFNSHNESDYIGSPLRFEVL